MCENACPSIVIVAGQIHVVHEQRVSALTCSFALDCPSLPLVVDINDLHYGGKTRCQTGICDFESPGASESVSPNKQMNKGRCQNLRRTRNGVPMGAD